MNLSTQRIALLSDLHFSYPRFHLADFISKRWLGNFNLFFSRKKNFNLELLDPLIEILKDEKVGYVLISGDLTSTALEKEFAHASAFVKTLQAAGLQTFVLPGNHDQYTRHAFKQKTFYKFFPIQFSQDTKYNLQDHKVTAVKLQESLWLVALDTAVATSLISSQGLFSTVAEKYLLELLSSIPKNETIILANHYPLFSTDGFRKGLQRNESLRHIITEYPNIKLYLHGHTHRQCVADLRINHYPIILDPGCTTLRDNAQCMLLDISPKGCAVDTFAWQNNWQRNGSHQFVWQPAEANGSTLV